MTNTVPAAQIPIPDNIGNISPLSMQIDLSPILPIDQLLVLSAIICVLTVLSLVIYRKGWITRLACAFAFMLALSNPSIIEEQRQSVSDVALVIIDQSPSQQTDKRQALGKNALEKIETEIAKLGDDIQTRTIYAPEIADPLQTKTELFAIIEKQYEDVAPDRRTGVIIITDGQVHDVPALQNISSAYNDKEYGPVHVLLTGDRKEIDRRIMITESPAYGIVGDQVTLEYVVKDTPSSISEKAMVTIRENDKPPRNVFVPINTKQTLRVTLQHTGQNIIHLQTPAQDNEITLVNNQVPIIINGVRDRLKVLLVSGRPHAGERTWRNILTSDPGIDLVHFTILRAPHKTDPTRSAEMSLIAFPVHELFEKKLYKFDLIIFDRYTIMHILPSAYFQNIAKYVKEGGAFLEVSGPEFADKASIYNTALKDILPAAPSGSVSNSAFYPQITDIGLRHPVTEHLLPQNADKTGQPPWGQWARQIGLSKKSGNTIMEGDMGRPLLILDRVGEGRVAQFSSDQIWLWSRGYQGGGPQAELLRRLSHWLMKEPELEENAMTLRVSDGEIFVTRRSLTQAPMTINVTDPENNETTLDLHVNQSTHRLNGHMPISSAGIYAFDDGTQKRYAIAGTINPKEFQAVITTADNLSPISQHSGGGVYWLGERSAPGVHHVSPRKDYSSSQWIGLKKNNSYVVSGTKQRPLFPSWLYAVFIAVVVIGSWWIEGRTSKKDS